MKRAMAILTFCAACVSGPSALASEYLSMYSNNGIIYATATVSTDDVDGFASVDMYIDGPGSHDSSGEYQCTYYNASSYQNLTATKKGTYTGRAWTTILGSSHWLLGVVEVWIERIRYNLSSSSTADPCTYIKSCLIPPSACSNFPTAQEDNPGGACPTNYYRFVTAVDAPILATACYDLNSPDEPDDVASNTAAFPCGEVQ